MSTFKNKLQILLTEAGNIIMKHRNLEEKIKEKEKNEIVTPADIASNTFLITELKKIYPDIPIYTEEGEENKSDDLTRWIIDPLDGTTPWVWGNSGFSISVALEKDGAVALGAVYDPVMAEFFYAEKGSGATRNGNKISVSQETDLKKMFFVVDWGNKDAERQEAMQYFPKFFLPQMFARRIIPQFAPALGLCRIAEGRTHAILCNETYVEDHSAGSLILQEAGGCVTNFHNNSGFSHREHGIIAANSKDTHSKIVKFLKLNNS